MTQPQTRIEERAESSIKTVSKLGNINDRSLLVAFMLVGLAGMVFAIYWTTNFFTTTIQANTAALARCAAALERMEAKLEK